jgi:peptide subunit release factor 1 (eRF1)
MRGGKYHSDRQGAPGWGERDYHERIRTEKERHYHAVARCLRDYDRQQPARGFVVAGPGPVPEVVARFLHPSLAPRLLGITGLNPTALSPAQAYAAALAVHDAHERAAERAKVAAIREGLGTGLAVNGLRPTLRALFRGQVRELLVPADAPAPGYRCAASGHLVITREECRGQGAPVPVADLLDDAIEEALRQHVPIAVLHDPEVAAEIEGLAATLRFR